MKMAVARGSLYEYAIIHHPKVKRQKDGEEIVERSKLIQDVQRVLASTPEEVSIIAAKAIPDEYMDKLEQVEIVVRPFGSA
jgi:hypothetical protein